MELAARAEVAHVEVAVEPQDVGQGGGAVVVGVGVVGGAGDIVGHRQGEEHRAYQLAHEHDIVGGVFLVDIKGRQTGSVGVVLRGFRGSLLEGGLQRLVSRGHGGIGVIDVGAAQQQGVVPVADEVDVAVGVDGAAHGGRAVGAGHEHGVYGRGGSGGGDVKGHGAAGGGIVDRCAGKYGVGRGRGRRCGCHDVVEAAGAVGRKLHGEGRCGLGRGHQVLHGQVGAGREYGERLPERSTAM